MEISKQVLDEVCDLFGLIDLSVEDVYSFITSKLIQSGVILQS